MAYYSEFLIGLLSTLFVTVTGFLFRSHSKKIEEVQGQMRDMELRLRSAITAAEVRQIIEDKLDPLKVQINEISSDIKEIKGLVQR